jgi:hypothetical protein
MSTHRASIRLATYAAVLAALLGGGVVAGAAIGPDVAPAEAEAPMPLGQGVVATTEGYRFLPTTTQLASSGGTFAFAIADQNGVPVRRFTPLHERDLHLIVANRELTEYHHVHPALGADDRWTIALPALPAGSYRAIADFQVADGPRLALGTDLTVPGDYEPAPLPEPTAAATVDGFDVSLATEPGAGGEVIATLQVRERGRAVELEPYLGANGHLVALRTGDIAYAHVHPVESDDNAGTTPGQVVFDATLPSAGRYRLFFDFKHAGVVHTAAFTFDQGAVTDESAEEH